MHRKSRGSTYAILLLLGTLLPAGCWVHTPLGPVRAAMQAPDLEYVPAEKLRTTMWVLAAEIQHLERLMTNPTNAEREALQSVVAATLERMRVAATTLDEPGRSTQHPVLNQNLGRFLDGITRAIRSVDRDPPNYYPASTIAGSCFLCHGKQSASVRWHLEPTRARR